MVRTPAYEPCGSIKESELLLTKRFLNPDFVAPPVLECSNEPKTCYQIQKGGFPILNHTLLNISPTDTRFANFFYEFRSVAFSIILLTSFFGLCINRNLKFLKEGTMNDIILQEVSLPPPADYTSLRTVFQPKQSNSSPASVAQANWEFIKQLLQVSVCGLIRAMYNCD